MHLFKGSFALPTGQEARFGHANETLLRIATPYIEASNREFKERRQSAAR
jgi:hypothetical protein